MDFFEIVHARHSVRAFVETPVEDEKVRRILEVANRAPSAGNLQGYEIYVVRQEQHKRALVRAAYDQEFLAEASLVLIFCANPSRSAVRYAERGEQLYSVQDATIACTYAMLAAAALGLASVWVGAFQEDGVRQAIGISQELVPVAMLPLGYAGKEPRQTPRRGLRDIIHET
ncbi:MAG: nitroreductase family protein [Anaerolineales bacterium]|nr:nitroreductase family protein [Anaerolineales bacterium]